MTFSISNLPWGIPKKCFRLAPVPVDLPEQQIGQCRCRFEPLAGVRVGWNHFFWNHQGRFSIEKVKFSTSGTSNTDGRFKTGFIYGFLGILWCPFSAYSRNQIHLKVLSSNLEGSNWYRNTKFHHTLMGKMCEIYLWKSFLRYAGWWYKVSDLGMFRASPTFKNVSIESARVDYISV